MAEVFTIPAKNIGGSKHLYNVLPINTAHEIDQFLNTNCVVAIGISGGKDSVAVGLAVVAHLDKIGHTGPRVLVHADLGVVEWKDSLPCCERLAAHLGLELITLKRKAGDMMDRWEGRWANNVARYNSLECVKLILPWSTPSMRFCTSELKAAVISAGLRKRFPHQDIVCVSGIRRQESATRAKMPVWAPDTRLTRKNAVGLTWNAIIDWDITQVFATIANAGLRLHEAYTVYGASRVSCAYCIMSAAKDLLSATSCADNHDVYRRMVSLEVTSTYAFQGGKWLAEVAPQLLSAELLSQVAIAKAKASARGLAESEIPKHLLFTKGWPTALPTTEEAELLASVRNRVNAIIGLKALYLTGSEVLQRYTELMAQKVLKENLKIAKYKKAGKSKKAKAELETVHD